MEPLWMLIAFILEFIAYRLGFAVKAQEVKGEMAALHGRGSIGVLIMQDIFPVLFLTFSSGKIPFCAEAGSGFSAHVYEKLTERRKSGNRKA